MTSSRIHAISRSIVAVLFLALGACGDDPQVPTKFEPSGASTMSGVVTGQASSAPQVRILDAKGKAIKGLHVRWKVGANSGKVVNDSTVTDKSGVAQSGGWTLGVMAGTQTLQATADGVSPVTFTAQVAPGPAVNLVRMSQDNMQATVNTNVPVAPSVAVQDAYGNVIPGVTVTFAALTGGGTMVGAQQVSDQRGIATVGAWKLGTGAGPQTARATSPSVNPANWTSIALPDAPADLRKAVGDNQQALAGLAVTIAPGVQVVDQYNNPISQVPVTFTPGPGSGTATPGTVTTDAASGTAYVNWVLGSASTQTLVATSSSINGKSVTFSATAVATSFDIDVRFIGEGGSPQIRQAFLDAASKWRKVIVGDAHTVSINRPAGTCGSWTPAITETVNDLVIFTRIGAIDGPDGILGGAGPCLIANSDLLTAVGVMEFDEADIASMLADGSFRDVVLHEMGHVLGFGSLWNIGRTFLVGAGSAAPYFTGANARAAFTQINTVTFSGNTVPVEGNQSPPGTRDGHWRTSVFGNELMQGYANGGAMPLSRVTAASMQDLGYRVNYGAVDPFTIASPILRGFPPAFRLLRDSEPTTPIYAVDRNGEVVKTFPRGKP